MKFIAKPQHKKGRAFSREDPACIFPLPDVFA